MSVKPNIKKVEGRGKKASIVPGSEYDVRIKKNAVGGILVTPEEIKSAFDFLDVDKSGKVSIVNLKSRLQVFYPDLTAKELRFLMNDKKDIAIDDLMEILHDNDVSNFDPVAEAFKAYDNTGCGQITSDRLKDVFNNFGFGELSDEELELLFFYPYLLLITFTCFTLNLLSQSHPHHYNSKVVVAH